MAHLLRGRGIRGKEKIGLERKEKGGSAGKEV